MTARPALRLLDLKKSFGNTKALRGVSFEVRRGTIHALLGGNGSGKSTLVKALAGVYPADGGQIETAATSLEASAMTPAEAREAGLRFVHQDTSTFGDLTIAENLSIGHGFDVGASRRINWRAVRQRVTHVLERFEVDARPDDLLSELSPASQTMVAIARALQDQDGRTDGILVLDEPTASLPAHEVELLLTALRKYARAGQTIVLVTHRLEEVLRAADRATILRDGWLAATVERAEMTHDVLVEHIAGRVLAPMLTSSSEHGSTLGSSRTDVVLEVESLAGGPVNDVSFALHGGEIVGLAGLLGSGRSSLLRMIFGLDRFDGGQVRLAGRPLTLDRPSDAVAEGIAYLPDERKQSGFFDMTLAENMSMARLGDFWSGVSLQGGRERAAARELIDAFGIVAASEHALLSSLSGGNQQKALMARWLRLRPRVLLLDEPTQGVDVGARADMYHMLQQAADEGATVLIVSSDSEELVTLCDRILVLHSGRITGELETGDIDAETLDRVTYTPAAPL